MKSPATKEICCCCASGPPAGGRWRGGPERSTLACDLLLCAALCWPLEAQQAGYSYDPSGNLLSLSSSAPLLPSLTSEPQSQLLESSAPVAFSVVASGPGLAYQWLSNGVPIAGATGDSLVLNHLSGTNFGSYLVVVSNASGAITSAPAAIWLDSNGTGMPDWWQMQYFGNLSQLPTGDFDGDGVWNLDEYLEGTNPANAASYNPRLYAQGVYGTVVASPAQPYYTLGQVITLTAVPDTGQQFVGWSGSIGGRKPVLSLVMNAHKYITASFGLPLPVALGNTNLVWTTGGSAPWFGQTEVSRDGVGAAQSGLVQAPDTAPISWLQTETTLNEPMMLTFWWQISAQPNSVFAVGGSPDTLEFSDQNSQGTAYYPGRSISGGNAGWEQVQEYLPAGNHVLLWQYLKNADPIETGIPFLDSGWVGDVTLTPYVLAPVFQSVILTNGGISLTWSAHAGSKYVVQYTTNLNQTNWTDLFSSPISGTNSTLTTSDSIAGDTQRFYRVVLVP